MDIALRKLGDVIVNCWDRAEEATIQAVAEKFPTPAEEHLTFLFSGELRAAVARASERREFERAFLEDVESAFPDVASNSFTHFSGLIAQVNLHSRWHEGHCSAADMGVVISRPSVRLAGIDRIEIVREKSQGLLAQAKLGQVTAGDAGMKWGPLTRKQEQLIPEHKLYYALLLYRLSGSSKNDLARFGWQLCGHHSVSEIKSWLRDGAFPSEIPSGEVIKKLSLGSVGTDSPSVIEFYIDPQKTQTSAIEIRVFWPDGEGPPDLVNVRQKTRTVVHVLASH